MKAEQIPEQITYECYEGEKLIAEGTEFVTWEQMIHDCEGFIWPVHNCGAAIKYTDPI